MIALQRSTVGVRPAVCTTSSTLCVHVPRPRALAATSFSRQTAVKPVAAQKTQQKKKPTIPNLTVPENQDQNRASVGGFLLVTLAFTTGLVFLLPLVPGLGQASKPLLKGFNDSTGIEAPKNTPANTQ